MGNPTGKGGFKKGKSGNEGGRPEKDPVVKKIQETTLREFMQALQKYGHFTKAQLAEELERPTATMFEIMFCQIVGSASRGAKDARQVLLDRLWGKVKDKVEYTDATEVERENIKRMSMNELIEKVKTLLPEEV